MTPEDKELLFKDLCARLPYGVKCHYDVVVPMIGKVKSYDKLRAISEFDSKPCFQFGSNRDIFDFDNIKPYLFPISSMTEEIMDEIYNNTEVYDIGIDSPVHIEIEVGTTFEDLTKIINILYKHHIDINGLIPKGLAIDCTNLNIY